MRKIINILTCILIFNTTVQSQKSKNYQKQVLIFLKNCELYDSIVYENKRLLIVYPKTANNSSEKVDCSVFSKKFMQNIEAGLKEEFDFSKANSCNINLFQDLFDSKKMKIGYPKVNGDNRLEEFLRFQNPLFSKKKNLCLLTWYTNKGASSTALFKLIYNKWEFVRYVCETYN